MVYSRRATLVVLVILMVCPFASSHPRTTSVNRLSNLDRAVVFAMGLEIHANHFEDRPDVCIDIEFGRGLKADERAILRALQHEGFKVHSNEWCNRGPRGLVISALSLVIESVQTYKLRVDASDSRPISQAGAHFATLLRRGTYTVRIKKDSEFELIRYVPESMH